MSKPFTKRWWWPTFVVVCVLFSLVEMEHLGVLEWVGNIIDGAQRASCEAADTKIC